MNPLTELTDNELVARILGKGRPLKKHRKQADDMLATQSLVDLVATVIAADRVREAVAEPAPPELLGLCFELGRRAFSVERKALVSAQDVADWSRDLELAKREHFIAYYLDARNNVLARETISIGTLSASLVHPREVFAPAIERRSAAIIVVHNHPSGDPEPSADDLALTRRLAQGGTLLGIEVLDHVIIGRGAFCSLKSRGLM